MSNKDMNNSACKVKFAVRQLSEEDLAGYNYSSDIPPFPITPQENVFDPEYDYSLKFGRCACSYINVQEGQAQTTAVWSGHGMHVSRVFVYLK